jgi:ribonuclease HII
MIGIDEVGRAASRKRRASPKSYVIGIDEVGRAASRKRRASPRYTIGIDEVGRGSLAGPVTVAAACVPVGARVRNRELGPLRDSKRLTPLRREAWYAHLLSRTDISFAVVHIQAKVIDRINISRAANRAALRALQRLMAQTGLAAGRCRIYLDGGLYLGDRGGAPPKGGAVRAKTVVKGDEKIVAVALASVVAKVRRDRLMVRLVRRYHGYGFEAHKGYGTRAHYRALRTLGPSPLHRLTFLSKSYKISKKTRS